MKTCSSESGNTRMSSSNSASNPATAQPCPVEQEEEMSPEFQQALYLASVSENSWQRQKPTERQSRFLYLTNREALYGGAAGGGKSSALLMGALQFVDCPGYAAILFRRTYADLSLPGALMDRCRSWLGETAAKWSD